MAPPTSFMKLWLENHIFTFSTSSMKQPEGGASYYARRLLKPRPLWFAQIMVELYLQAFWQNFENGKMQKFGFCFQDLKKSSSPKLLNIILRYCTLIVLGYVLLKFVQVVAAPYIIGEILAENNLIIVNLMQNL